MYPIFIIFEKYHALRETVRIVFYLVIYLDLKTHNCAIKDSNSAIRIKTC
jgi:hypothetical protein